MTGVVVTGLYKSFGATAVLKDVSLEAAPGEFVALVGPSGCGKSTLLRCIAGLEAINAGAIAIGGRDVTHADPKERDAAMVFQNYALYPHMTVAENMGFSVKLRGGGKAEIAARVAEAAKILGLTPYLDRYPRQLSGGQRQRVAMGRAIVRKPSVFLFDEPLSNLDAALRVQMRAEIRALHRRLGVTSIYVTHDQIEAMTMADRIVVLRAGVVEQAGRPLDLYDHPRNTFVATFIGSPAMNLVEALVTDRGLLLADGQILPRPLAGALPEKVQLGLRPEHLTVAPGPGPGALAVRVATCETTGATSYLTGLMGETLITVTVQLRMEQREGDTVWLTLAPDHLHVFDAATGQRLGD
jgi:multiple sugar transport system ATP-binding protein